MKGDHADTVDTDALYARARTLVLDQGEASVALVQRNLRLGYGPACALFERMQAAGLVAPKPGAPRQWVLVDKETNT